MNGPRPLPRALRAVHNLHDLREAARRTLPRGVFEFIDRGVEDEIALRDNRAAFEGVRLAPRLLVDVTGRTAATTLFGRALPMPVAVAPTGSAGLVWFQGELELARAAASAGVPFTLATNAMTSVEQVAGEAGGRLWFQLNMFRDRAIARALVERVRRHGFEALLLTADASVVPNREYNARNGFALPFRVAPRSFLDLARHPRWLATVIGRYLAAGGLPRFENHPPAVRTAVTGFSTTASAGRCEDLTWDDVRWLRDAWPGRLIVKGVLRAEDAAAAADLGVDGIVVSNHGGRTLDSAPAPLDRLPGIVDAVGDRMVVLLDGGIRRGSDVLKAVALGADAVLIGRPTLYGTAVAGRDGAAHALTLLRTEIERELGLLGCNRPDEVADLIVERRRPPRRRPPARSTAPPPTRRRSPACRGGVRPPATGR